VVGWVLRSAVIDKRRHSGGSHLLTNHERAGYLAVDRLVVSFAYARCMIGTGAGIVVSAIFIVPATALPPGPDRMPLYGVGLAVGGILAATQLVVLSWFSTRGGRYKTRVLRTTPASLRVASIAAGLLAVAGGIVFAFATGGR
jgi:cytochrome bd-type quinol oxidase subunit 1